MRYLKEGPFLNRKGQPITINLRSPQQDDQRGELSVSLYLKIVLEAYTPSRELQLTMGEWRRCQAILDILDAGINETGWFSFEDSDYAIMEKTVTSIVMHMVALELVQNGPQLVDLLQDAPHELPKKILTQVDGDGNGGEA